MRANDATYNITCPQVETCSFVFISKGWAIIWNILINHLAKPYWYELQDVRHPFQLTCYSH